MTGGFKFDPSKNLIVVDAEIWSADESYSHIIPLALDTGASTTIIPWEIIEYLGYAPHIVPGLMRKQIVTGSGIEFVPEVIVTTFQSLGKTAKSMPV